MRKTPENALHEKYPIKNNPKSILLSAYILSKSPGKDQKYKFPYNLRHCSGTMPSSLLILYSSSNAP